MWTVMMIGMMGPSAAPVLLLFAAGRRGQTRTLSVLLFAFGYLAVWTGFSAVAAFAQWMLQRAAWLSPSMSAASPYLGAAILIAAGIYQLTPFKAACLTHCRSPLGFLMTNWRDGSLGAFVMGGRHGGYCLGCCWALMGVLFAVGVMNLAWVGVLTAFVLVEKFGPAGAIAARIGGVVMIGGGLVAAIAR
jgi:predicted metal-binding membrane protein